MAYWLPFFFFFSFLVGGGVLLSDLWLAERCASLPWTPSAAFRLRRRRHPRWEAKAVAGCLAHDSVSKNTSTETQAYAHASVWRSSRLCFSLSPSKCWSEELNYSRRPARVWFATVCFLVAFEWDPWSKAFRDQPVLMGACDLAVAPACSFSVSGMVFCPAGEGESAGQRWHLTR